jgi:hypothetical protein
MVNGSQRQLLLTSQTFEAIYGHRLGGSKGNWVRVWWFSKLTFAHERGLRIDFILVCDFIFASSPPRIQQKRMTSVPAVDYAPGASENSRRAL